jgi:hypothetical protein
MIYPKKNSSIDVFALFVRDFVLQYEIYDPSLRKLPLYVIRYIVYYLNLPLDTYGYPNKANVLIYVRVIRKKMYELYGYQYDHSFDTIFTRVVATFMDKGIIDTSSTFPESFKAIGRVDDIINKIDTRKTLKHVGKRAVKLNTIPPPSATPTPSDSDTIKKLSNMVYKLSSKIDSYEDNMRDLLEKYKDSNAGQSDGSDGEYEYYTGSDSDDDDTSRVEQNDESGDTDDDLLTICMKGSEVDIGGSVTDDIVQDRCDRLNTLNDVTDDVYDGDILMENSYNILNDRDVSSFVEKYA